MARTSLPFLLGKTIQEEVDDDIQIPMVDETPYTIKVGFTSEEPGNPSLARMMEQEIARVVKEWRAGERVFDAVNRGPNVAVVEMERDLEEYLAEREETACVFLQTGTMCLAF